MNTAIYLDYNATAPAPAPVREAAARACRTDGNPSSPHGAGRAAREIVETARDAVAALLGVPAQAVIFTSGGAEANALALHQARDSGTMLIPAMEHASVLAQAQALARRPGAPHLITLPVDGQGVLRLAALRQALETAPPPVFLSLQAANNETGVLQPVEEAAALVHAAGGRVHCDAAQVAGRMPFAPLALGADLVTVSAHKMGGLAGTGALLALDDGAASGLMPLIAGGGQEEGRRAGTENLAGCAAFGTAAALCDAARMAAFAACATLRDHMERLLCATAPVTVFGAGAPRLPNTSCFAAPGPDSETLIMALDLEGIAVSAGAACSSGKMEPSHVLSAQGAPANLARSALRVSLGWDTTPGGVARFVQVWRSIRARAGYGSAETALKTTGRR